MNITTEVQSGVERVAELVSQYDEKAAVSLQVARDWLVTIHVADFHLIFDALRGRALQSQK